MALRDYRSEDEDDYYGQGFQRPGVVSVWVGMRNLSDYPREMDLLQDLCGVGYYALDQNEIDAAEAGDQTIAGLMRRVSYAESFKNEVEHAAHEGGITRAQWIVLQYDYAYDPCLVKRQVSDDVAFLGVFHYQRRR